MHLLKMTFLGFFEQFHFFWHLLEQCRAVKILVSSSFFEQMNFEQMTLLPRKDYTDGAFMLYNVIEGEELNLSL
jgi:hypothetical protein